MVDGGAIALSILTEPRKFKGSFGNLKVAAESVPRDMPLLMKDFVIDETQLKLGKICGASNALLIASICDPLEMAKMMLNNGLEPLIEIHDQEDLAKIRPLAKSQLNFVIGVNNRNLRDLTTSFTPTIELIPLIQDIFGENQPIISESGIFTRADMIRVEQAGAKAALVGTSIMQGDIEQQLRLLLGKDYPFIKVCGISQSKTLESINDPRVSAIGFVVGVPQSKRNLGIKDAKSLMQKAPPGILKVIVTKDKTLEDIVEFDNKLSPDLIQCHGQDIISIAQRIGHQIRKKLIIPIRIENGQIREPFQQISSLPSDIFAVLLDSSEGSGKNIDIKAAKELMSLFPNYRIIVAGGIGPHNIQTINQELGPYGIDSSSCLEIDGQKNDDMIRLFLKKSTKKKQYTAHYEKNY
jgi:indole-3-glycerol phosphate synthase/phosphoribosylanthranilate isomerase